MGGMSVPSVSKTQADRLDAAISSRASATDYTSVRAAKLDDVARNPLRYFVKWTNTGNMPASLGQNQYSTSVWANDFLYIYYYTGSAYTFSRWSSGTGWQARTANSFMGGAPSNMVWTGGDFIYVLDNSGWLRRYSISGDSWTTLQQMVASPGDARFLVWNGSDYLYSSTNAGQFYRYSISGAAWTSLGDGNVNIEGGAGHKAHALWLPGTESFAYVNSSDDGYPRITSVAQTANVNAGEGNSTAPATYSTYEVSQNYPIPPGYSIGLIYKDGAWFVIQHDEGRVYRYVPGTAWQHISSAPIQYATTPSSTDSYYCCADGSSRMWYVSSSQVMLGELVYV